MRSPKLILEMSVLGGVTLGVTVSKAVSKRVPFYENRSFPGREYLKSST